MNTLACLLLCFVQFISVDNVEVVDARTEREVRPDGRQIVRVYAGDEFYADDKGELQRIEVDIVREDGGVWKEERNTLKVEVDEATGAVTHVAGEETLLLTPVSLNGTPYVAPKSVESTKRSVIFEGVFGKGTQIEKRIRGGMIKEFIRIAESDSKTITITWAYTSSTPPELTDEGGIQWGKLHTPAPTSWDRKQNLDSHFTLDKDTLTLTVDVSDAAFPVTIDPTVSTTGGDVQATRTTGEDFGGSGEEMSAWYIKITAPALTGWTSIESATLHLPVNFYYGIPGNFQYYCAQVTDFSNSTNAATLTGLSFGTSLGNGTPSTSALALNVLGDSSKGLLKVYEDGTPTYLYFKGYYGGSTSSAYTDIGLGWEYDGSQMWWHNPSVEITYTNGGGGGDGDRGGFFVFF